MIQKSIFAILLLITFQHIHIEGLPIKKKITAKEKIFRNVTIKDVAFLRKVSKKDYENYMYTVKEGRYNITLDVFKEQKRKTISTLLKNFFSSINPLSFRLNKKEQVKEQTRKKLANMGIDTKFCKYHELPYKKNRDPLKNTKGISGHNYPGIYKAKLLLYTYWLKHDKEIPVSYRKKIEKEIKSITIKCYKLKILAPKPLDITPKAHKQFSDIIIKTS